MEDRSEGGSSVHDGSIELMLHRRTLYDDSLGVGEPINETAFGQGLVVRGSHYLLLERPESSALHHRHVAQRLFMSPLITYALPTVSYANYSSSYHQTWSALNQSLPYNVHLLTFDQLSPKVFLVRIEHYFELNEDATFSSPVQVDLQALFYQLGQIDDVLELTLTANLPLSDLQRLVWKTVDNQSSAAKTTSIAKHSLERIKRLFSHLLDKNSAKSSVITLNPMEIKTFQVTLQ